MVPLRLADYRPPDTFLLQEGWMKRAGCNHFSGRFASETHTGDAFRQWVTPSSAAAFLLELPRDIDRSYKLKERPLP
jgi:hypothetical protein